MMCSTRQKTQTGFATGLQQLETLPMEAKPSEVRIRSAGWKATWVYRQPSGNKSKSRED
jgi:hypothetical protein